MNFGISRADVPIKESERKYHWDTSKPRPDDRPEFRDVGL